MNEYDEYLKEISRKAMKEAVARLGTKEDDNDLPPDWTSVDLSKPLLTDGWSEPVQILLQTGVIKDNFTYNGFRFLPIIGRNLNPKSVIVAWRYCENAPFKINKTVAQLRSDHRAIPTIDNPFDGSGTNFHYETSDAMKYERYYIDNKNDSVKIVKETTRGDREQVYTDKSFQTVKEARRFLRKEAEKNGWWLVNGRDMLR